ncbi:hypothetical protein IOBOPIKK_00015 [Klebsiella phage vB_KpnS_SCNJ1-C]|nr:hypothetical protein IOBOPIKK_00015 [Klebsiella phage vB_KpnS_SCNJ1-C]
MTKMTSREQFEGWATNAGFIVTTKNDGYLYPATNSAWQAWQASREAIEIELPEQQDPADFFCAVYSVDGVVSALNKHGLKVKS